MSKSCETKQNLFCLGSHRKVVGRTKIMELLHLYFYCVFVMVILCKRVYVGCEKHLLA